VIGGVDPEGSHRARLLAGMATAIREHGYGATTVAEVVANARTSRRTFYQHFEDRDACFLALFDALALQLLEVVTEGATGDGPYLPRLDAALTAYLDQVATDPELTRSMILELPAIGPAGVARDREATERIARQLLVLVTEAAEHDPDVQPPPFEAWLVVVAGFRELVIHALEHGRPPAELHAVALDLVRRITTRGG
jgi:AcrR family transcriptional regulator